MTPAVGVFSFSRDGGVRAFPGLAGQVGGAADRPPIIVEPGMNPGEPGWLRGGTGGDAEPAGPGTEGVVLADGAQGERPVAGAWLVTPDGHRLLANEQGRFRVPEGSPVAGRWVVGARAHITSVVEGYEPEGMPTLHLEPFAREVAAGPPPTGVRTATLTGTVVDEGGQPVPRCVVLLGGAGVVAALPVLTDATGAYTMTPRLSAVGGGQASLLALGGGRLGLARLALTGQDQVLAAVPARLAAHELAVSVTPVADLPSPTVTAVLRTEDGTVLSLPGDAGKFRVAELPGVRYDLTVEARAADGSAYSRVERPALTPDWSRAATTVEAALLPVPEVPDVPLAVGGAVRWQPVAGAAGYTLSVAGPVATPGWPWEGFTTGTELAVALPGGVLQPGAYQVGVTAWDAPGVAVRTLASLEGVRALRRVDRSKGVRESHRSRVVAL